MGSIFLRIYVGMLAAMLLIAALAYGVVELVDQWRAEAYREEMASGTFRLMASSASHAHGAERERWLQVMSVLFGAPVRFVTAEDAAFTAAERDRLRDGRVLFRAVPAALAGPDAAGAVDIFVALPAEPLYVTTRLVRATEQHARATAVLILDELGRHPVNEWDAAFATMQGWFGYPIARRPLAEVRLDKDQLERLARREVVISLSENAPSDQSAVRIYAPVGNRPEVLELGPLHLFDRRPMTLVIPVGALALMMMGLAAYLLVRPLERRLKRLEGAVQRVGAGDLSARAEVPGNDAVGRLAASFNGMTAQIARLIEAQREMTRAVSHELRTPVARIRFGLEMVADSADPAARAAQVAAIDRDIDELDTLIDEILTYARLEEGAPLMQFDSVDLPALAQRIRAELATLAGSVEIRIEAPAELVVQGNERYLHRVLQNLVTNAIRYARGQVLVRCLEAGGEVELVVEDDGPGIPAADRERVFQPFARLDNSRHRASGGYGLGLSIVQRIGEWHGGRVWVDASPALGGAAFHLRWPRQARVPA